MHKRFIMHNQIITYDICIEPSSYNMMCTSHALKTHTAVQCGVDMLWRSPPVILLLSGKLLWMFCPTGKESRQRTNNSIQRATLLTQIIWPFRCEMLLNRSGNLTHHVSYVCNWPVSGCLWLNERSVQIDSICRCLKECFHFTPTLSHYAPYNWVFQLKCRRANLFMRHTNSRGEFNKYIGSCCKTLCF